MEKNVDSIEDIFENSPKAMIMVDEHAAIHKINRSCIDMVGIDAKKILGKLPGEILNCSNAGSNKCGEHMDCSFCNLRGALTETLFYKSEIINRPVKIHRHLDDVPSILDVNISTSYIDNPEKPLVLISITPV